RFRLPFFDESGDAIPVRFAAARGQERERLGRPRVAAADRHARVFSAVIEAEEGSGGHFTSLSRVRERGTNQAQPAGRSSGMSKSISRLAGPESHEFSPISRSSCPAPQPA